MKTVPAVCLALIVLLSVALSIAPADAYERYKDNGVANTNCAECHSDFTDNFSPSGANITVGKHDMHRSGSWMNTDCDLCHTQGDDRNPFIGSSNGTNDNTGYGCVGCHGRLEDAGNDGLSAGRGAGLRQHHTNAGMTLCMSCHSDADPANYTPVGEHVKPPYYDTPDTNASMPCNAVAQEKLNENWTVGDFLGLDNDGDDLYDAVDSDDCGMVADCPDDDNDGWAVCGTGCEPAAGDQCGDCNDNDATVNPDGTEGPFGDITCEDVLDNDCDTLIDVDDPDCDPAVVFCEDGDADGYAVCDGNCEVASGDQCGDCDDNAAAVNPGATEVCDGIDNDCDTLVDDDDPDVTGQSTWYADTDSDTYGDAGNAQLACTMPTGFVSDNTDCNDNAAAANPAATEGPLTDPTCDDGLDNDCDTLVDTADPDCESTVVFCPDDDSDGYAVCSASCEVPANAECGDCDDNAAAVNPGAAEVCDGIDNDCDGLVDDDDPGVTGQDTWYADTDSDGFGDAGNSLRACAMPAGYVSDDTDCDDNSAAANPAATEGPSTDPTCSDGLDNDCDTLVDTADPGCEPAVVCPDDDFDGYAVCGAGCELPAGTECGDCDDGDPFVNPAATEGPYMDPTCGDGLDNDCDGFVDGDDSVCIGPTASDYDIRFFRCSPKIRTGKRATLWVTVRNRGDTDPGAQLTVYGMRMDGTTIPIVMDLEVFDPVGDGHNRLTFSYTPVHADLGRLTWTAVLVDGTTGAEDDAQDTATCVTDVAPGKGAAPGGQKKGFGHWRF